MTCSMLDRKFIYPFIYLAIFGIFLGFVAAIYNNLTTTVEPPSRLPTKSPFKSYIYGTGIIEANTQNISVGSPTQGIVQKVYVQAGDVASKNDKLFELDHQDLDQQKMTKAIDLQIAMAHHEKLKQEPRQVSIVPLEAQIRAAEANYLKAKQDYEIADQLQATHAISPEEFYRRKHTFAYEQARFEEAQAELTKLKAGPFESDLEAAKQEILKAKSLIAEIEIEIEKKIVRAPLDGTVLLSNLRVGEYVENNQTPLLLLGNTSPLHLRVSVDENEVIYFDQESKAEAFVFNEPSRHFPLKFVRKNFYLIPKKNLNNNINEKVDTRVLEVVYEFIPHSDILYVGQKMDVYIEKRPTPITDP